MDVSYEEAGRFKLTECRAWLIEYGAGGVDVLLTAVSIDIIEVVAMVRNHTHDDFRVSNITVGQLPIDPDWRKEGGGKIPAHLHEMYSIYSNEGRKVDQDGMVQI